jgi:hypothetical protein
VLLTKKFIPKSNLDTLYAVALRQSGPWDTDERFAQDARAVLACVVLGRVPMTDGTIDMLLGQHSAKVLIHLGCVVQWTPGTEARTLHASFTDYLTDSGRSGHEPWAIDAKVQHVSLAQGCFRILNRELRFNICCLEDSHLLNADVPQIEGRISEHISPHLTYSTRFWYTHIREAPFDEMVLRQMKTFFLDKYLYWLEALSLLEEVSMASAASKIAADYVEVLLSLI